MAPLQGSNSVVIDASPARVWTMIEDASLLPRWVPLVDEVEQHSECELPGSVRRCRVSFGGRSGYIVERCVEAEPERLLRHAVDEDSLGFNRMFRDYSFELRLAPATGGTRVECATFYEPRNPAVAALNALFMRRRFAATREEILAGLKRAVEEHVPGPAALPPAQSPR